MTSLIIDTDVALGVHHEGRPRDIDDGFAIVEAINSDSIDLLAVTTVFGNAPLTDVDRVAGEIIALKDADVRVASGAAVALPALGELPPPNAAVETMADILRQQSCHIAAIGPLTNMGLLVAHFPELLASIESVIIVAGRSRDQRFYLGDAGPVRDFNFENDVRAADMLMRSGVELVLAGFELTSQVSITEADLETINRSESSTAGYFYRNSLAWCRHWTSRFPADSGFHPWDSAAISWLKHPDYFVTEARGWRIREHQEDQVSWLETDPDFSGQTVSYCTGFSAGGAQRFVEDVVTSVY